MLKNAGILLVVGLLIAAFAFIDLSDPSTPIQGPVRDSVFKDTVKVDTWRNNGIYYAKSTNLSNVPIKVKVCYVTDHGQYRSKDHYLIRPGGSATFHSNYGINHVSAIFHPFTDPRVLECPLSY